MAYCQARNTGQFIFLFLRWWSDSVTGKIQVLTFPCAVTTHCHPSFLLYSVVIPASFTIISLIKTYYWYYFLLRHNVYRIWMFFSNMEMFSYQKWLKL